MKCIVIYFSQTGNTEKIARSIHAGVLKAAGHCDLVKLKEADPRRLQQYDLIGIGCAVFGYAESINTRAFIKDMRFVGGKHVFAFATHGTHGEFFASSIAPRLKRRGMTVLGVRDWYGNTYIPGAPDPYPTAGHPDEIDCREAETFGMEMVELSRKIYAGDASLIPPMPKRPGISLREEVEALRRQKLADGTLKEDDEKKVTKQDPKYNKELCIYPKCRLCMDNCPMDGIDLTVDPPIIASPCMHCMFCSKICPTGAMDHLFFFETPAERTWKTMPEFHLNQLDRAEAEGRFRRLVPKEKIGLDTPYYKNHNKRPWWVIGKGLQ